ncbi:MAG: YeiH family putative sulfate export transporter [Clostridia bacterium]|nr:YeiH family putative sulfate export transporter [Clostridia bacterium]
MEWLRANGPGLLLCLIISVPAYWLGLLVPVVGGPVFAILIGMVLALIISRRDHLQTGINFTSKKILQWAVIVLGFGMDLAEVLLTGSRSLPIILSTIAIALILAWIMHRALHMESKISTLVGVGSSICGGSAIAATAPVIDADDAQIAQSISVIFLYNVIAALIFPSLGQLLGLSNEGFALFAGTAVNDTSSVTAAATAWDGMHASDTLSQATIVKMTRTLAIIPITLVLAFVRTSREKKAGSSGGVKVSLKQIFPWFVLWFVVASVITTVFQLPAEVTSPLKTLSRFLIVMAMAAIGFNTNIVKLFRTGGKPILMGLVCWVGIAAVSLLMQRALGLW